MFKRINILHRHLGLHYITPPSHSSGGGWSGDPIIHLSGAGTNDINRRVVA